MEKPHSRTEKNRTFHSGRDEQARQLNELIFYLGTTGSASLSGRDIVEERDDDVKYTMFNGQ